MTLTALIAEDEPLLARALQAELAQAWPALQVVALAQDGDEAVSLALQHLPTVVWLDIRMPGRDGLEAAQAMVEDWPPSHALPLIVFVTAYDHYALQAFERAAADYLLKPVQPERLQACCLRLQSRLASNTPPGRSQERTQADGELLAQLRQLLATPPEPEPEPEPKPARLQVLQVSQGTKLTLVPVDQVLYFEAADKYVRAVTAHQEHLVRLSLRELLTQLDPEAFWQVHRGTVVRWRAVAQAVRDETGKLSLHLHQRPERLPVSRLFAHRFRGH